MAVQIENHPSPNHSSRNGVKVKVIVIHATAGVDSLAHLCDPNPGNNPENAVSAHNLITKTGKIYQLVKYNRRAWHAGWAALPSITENIGDCSIGIEIENLNNGRDPYPAAQLKAAVELVQNLVAEYNIARIHVVKHADVALPLGRKSDPQGSAFDMENFLDQVFGNNDQTFKMVVTHNGVRIRKAGGTDFAILGQLNAGQEVAIDGLINGEAIQGNHFWARLADTDGYVSMRFLREP